MCKILRSTTIIALVGAQLMMGSTPQSSAAEGDPNLSIVGDESGLTVVAPGSSIRRADATEIGRGRSQIELPGRAGSTAGEMRGYKVQNEKGVTEDFIVDRTVKAASSRKRRVGWTRTENSVGVEWASTKEIENWEITTPDGRKVRTTKNFYIDNSAALSGTYLVTGSDPDEGVETFALSIPDVSSVKPTLVQSSTSSAGADQYRGVVWAAFIAEDKVQAKVGVHTCIEYYSSGYHFYGGDDRTFVDSVPELYSADARHFRVGSAVASTWRGSAWVNPTIYDSLVLKETGVTTAYGADGELLATAQANAQTDVTLESGTSEILPPNLGGMGLATRVVKMDSSNPLCTVPSPTFPYVAPAPAISVNYDYRHTSNGWVTVEGSHDRAPMHEVLWVASEDEGDPAKPSGCLYRFRNQGFEHLVDTPLNDADVTLDFNPAVSTPSCVTV